MQKYAVNSTILLHKNTDHRVGWLLQQEWANNLKLLQAISRSRAKSESIQTPWQKSMMWTHQERELTQCEFAQVEGSAENSQNWKMCAFFRNSSCCHKATVLTSQEVYHNDNAHHPANRNPPTSAGLVLFCYATSHGQPEPHNLSILPQVHQLFLSIFKIIVDIHALHHELYNGIVLLLNDSRWSIIQIKYLPVAFCCSSC